MWRIFKKKETETLKISDKDIAKQQQTKIVVTKTGTKEVPLSTEIKDVQLEGNVKETTTSVKPIDNSPIVSTHPKKNSIDETSDSETLNDRLKAIQDIVDKAQGKNKPISNSTAHDEDLSKFEPFISDNIEVTKEKYLSEIDDKVVDKAFLGGDIALNINTESQNEVNQVDDLNSVEINDDIIEEPVLKDEVPSLDEPEVIDDVSVEMSDTKEDILEDKDVEDIAGIVEQNKINRNIDDTAINQIFEYLNKNFTDKFLAGALYDVQAKEMIHQHRFEKNQLDVFTNLFEKINAASSRSGFPKLNNYYVLDLENDQTAFVLLFPNHHFVLIFDKSKIQLGYIISIIRPHITNEYNIAIN